MVDYSLKSKLLAQKAEADRQLARIEKEEAEMKKLPLPYRVADLVHSMTCHADHTEHCGWFYENWHEKLGDTRKRYIKRAEQFIEEFTAQQLRWDPDLGDSLDEDYLLEVMHLCLTYRY